MKIIKISTILIPILFSLVGCNTHETTLHLKCYSVPSEATLYQENQNMGTTPLYLAYPLSIVDIKKGYLVINKMHVRWISGATTTNKNIRIDLSKGYFQKVIFIRPKNIKGIEEDDYYALEIERTKMKLINSNNSLFIFFR